MSLEKEISKSLFGSSVEEGKFVSDEFQILIDKDLEDIIAELNASGVSINQQRLADHIKEFQEKELTATADFEAEVQKCGQPINTNKRADLVKYFFTILGLPVYKSGKTGPSLDSESLEFLSSKHPSAGYYAAAKQAHSMVTTLKNIQAAVHDGRIYPQHNLNKAASGRFSSSGANGDKLNINGWPKAIRDILTTDQSEGTEIVSFDYKNVEGAVQYFLAHEQGAIEDYLGGVDMHQKLADILGVDRKTAKIIRHGIGYGMTAFGLARRLNCTEEEAEKFIEKFWEQQPKVKTFKQHIIHLAHMYGEVQTISGFSRKATGLSDDQIYSTMIQGSAADIFKNAVAAVQKFLRNSHNGKVKVIMHDAIICEIVQNDEFDYTIESIKEIMENIHPNMALRVQIEKDNW